MVDYGTAVIGPGLVDVHVHMNEPGRVEWEGVVSKPESLTRLELQQRQHRRHVWPCSACRQRCGRSPLLRALCDRWRVTAALHATPVSFQHHVPRTATLHLSEESMSG